MTLQDWNAAAKGYGILGAVPFVPRDNQTGQINGPATGAYVVPDFNAPCRTALFGLSDYCVSSVTGGTIWLIPR